MNHLQLRLSLGLFGLVATPTFAQTPTIEETGWTLADEIDVPNAISAAFHPIDGDLYVLRRGSGADGLYRIENDDTLTLLASASSPAGLVIDPDDGDLFFSESATNGSIYRTAYGTTGRETWVSGFLAGDDDPMGMVIAPNDYAGQVLQPGEGFIVDFGYSQNPPGAWTWSPDQSEGEVNVLGDSAGVDYYADCTIGDSRLWVVDHDWGGANDGGIFEVTAINNVFELATSEPLSEPVAIVYDRSRGDLLIKDAIDQRVVRVDPSTGQVSTVFSGFGFQSSLEWIGLDFSPDNLRLAVTDYGSGKIWVFERAFGGTTIASSNDLASALPLTGPLSAQLAALNATPPAYDPLTWQPVARHADFEGDANFQFRCVTPGVRTTVSPAIASAPPASQNLYHNQWESDLLIPIIDERIEYVLQQPLIVDVEYPAGGDFQTYQDMPAIQPTLPVGTRVSSHLIHFDTVGNNSLTYGVAIAVFETPIRALIARGSTLNGSDAVVGLPGLTYSSPLTERGMELADVEDFIQVSADGLTLTFGMRVMNWLDEIRVITESPDPLAQPYVSTSTPLAGVDEVTYDNCSSAWYRFTFQMPSGAKNPELYLTANVDDQGVLFLNGQRVSGLMTEPGCDPIDPTNPNDGCYALQDTGSDGVDNAGDTILTAPTADELLIADASLFVEGENELIFAVCGDASAYEPTGLEFEAFLLYDPAATSYCTAKLDTAGCAPQIASTGTPSVTSPNAFDVSASGVQNLKPGLMFYGFAQAALPWNGGTLCIQPPLRRTSIQFSGGSPSGTDCTGAFSFDFNAWTQSGLDPLLTAGTDVFAQYWYRDPAGSFGSGLSDALRFELCP